MTSAAPANVHAAEDVLGPGDSPGGAADRLIRGLMEAVVLAMVCLSPWALAAVEPWAESLLFAGVAALLVLWGARLLLGRRPAWRLCPVSLCLAGLILVGLAQVTPMPRGLLGRVSPATARWYDRLLPGRPEVLPDGQPRAIPSPPAGSTLSVAPGGTWKEVGRLAAVLALFAVVAHNLASPAALRRLAVAATVDGVLLAFFGVVQFFAAEPGTVYWSIPVGGTPFGPFGNRDHFAMFVNMGIGLGLGLLIARLEGPDGAPAARARGGWTDDRTTVLGRSGPILRRLLEPEVLALVFALALMISGVIFCLSRGGFLALLGGAVVGAATLSSRSRHPGRGLAVLVVIALAIAMVSWFGLDLVAERLATLRGVEALEDRRLDFWMRALPVMGQFPLWGTGYGTYQYADMLGRTDAVETATMVDHAHNEFVEAMVEGGLPRLILTLVGIAWAFRLGLRSIRRQGDGPTRGLLIGALIGFTTLVLHSVVEFGIHLPAVTVLAAVLAAQLVAPGLGPAPGRPEAMGRATVAPAGPSKTRRRGATALLGGGLLIGLGLLLAAEGWRSYRADQLRRLAFDQELFDDPGAPERKVAFLEAATRLLPRSTQIRAELAYAHLDALEARRLALQWEGIDLETAGDDAEPKDLDPAVEARLERTYLPPALRQFLLIRDLCPMSYSAQLDLTEYAPRLAVAEPRRAYLERAKLLAPDDPWVWFECGTYELEDGRTEQAWASWRRSLQLADDYLPEILEGASAVLAPAEVVRLVLPDRPALLLRAAGAFGPESAPARRAALERAAALLADRPATAEDAHLRSQVLRDLGRDDEALEALRAAVTLEPLRLDWHYELAELAYRQGQLEEAHRELLTILGLDPQDRRARRLLDEVSRKIAETL